MFGQFSIAAGILLIFLIFVMLAAFGGLSPVELMVNPVVRAIDDSWLWFLYFVLVAAAGIYFQLQTNKDYEIEEYTRWA